MMMTAKLVVLSRSTAEPEQVSTFPTMTPHQIDAYSPTDFFNEKLSFPLTCIIDNGVVKELIYLASDHWKKEEHE